MRREVLAIFGAAAVALFIAAFNTGVGVVENEPTPVATTTLAVIPQVMLPPIVLPQIDGAATTTSPKKTSPSSRGGAAHPVPPSAPVESPAATSSPVAPAPPVLPEQTGDIAASASELRTALVNILCLVPQGGGLESISGSGVIISPNGMILTNSHVAQYFLLGDRGVSCSIRTGSPATSSYHAELAFISPAWIAANPNVLEEQAPSGTGQYDFAVLAIDGSVTSAPLPASFPYVALGTNPPAIGEQIVIGSYAAQFLQISSIESALSATIVYGAIQNVFTFATNSVDVASLGGTAAAQEGSSGGGVIDANGDLVATITTSTTEGNTADRNLNAITASYIRRDYEAETGSSIDSLIFESPALAISNFAPQIPHLESVITADLAN